MKRNIALAFVLLTAAVSLQSQVTTATFYGVVEDSSGAVVPTARVRLVNSGTGTVWEQLTSGGGEFAFTFLPVGMYTLRIEAPGFRAYLGSGIELRAAQQARQTYVLEVGSVSEQVEVTGGAPLVNAVTAEQRESISRQEVQSLPVSRRTLSNLFTIGTGISPGRTGQFTLNGLGQAATSITMDGIDASGNPQAPAAQFAEGHNYIAVTGMEAVEEVQVSKGVFSAEYGRALGGNINVITKSGSNVWRGSLFHLFNSQELNAREQFLASKPATTFNQYGGSVGGRLVRDRVFFFSAVEGYQERTATAVNGNVPTERLRAEMLAADANYKLLLDTYPLPNQPHAANADTGAYIGAGSITSSDLHWVARPDVWLIPSRLLLTGTYVRSRPDRVIPRVQPVNSRLFEGKTDRFNITATFIGGPSWSAETRFGYNRNDRNRIDGYWNLADPNKAESRFGGRRLPGVTALGLSGGGEWNIIGRAPHRSIDQKFAWTRGRHSLKFGGMAFFRELGNENIENPSLQYANKADLLANVPSLAQFTFGRDDYDGKAAEFGVFLQEDFRASSSLTLNLGFRYDWFGHFVSHSRAGGGRGPHVFNFSSLALPGFAAGPFRPFDNPYDNDAVNAGPRFGFAFNPGGRSKTVIRGGFAAMFTPINGELVKNMVQNAADEPFRTRLSRSEAQGLRVKFPAYNEDVLALVKGGQAAPGFQFLDPQGGVPYSMNFSLTVERALTGSLALETAFVGTRGVKFHLLRFYNEVDRATGRRPNPALAAERYYDNSDSSRYYSWQTSLRRRFSRGLAANVHYTWGKAISYARGDIGFGGPTVQDFFDIRSNRGPSESDVVHRLVSDFVYDLPGPALDGPLRPALAGWQVAGLFSANTGIPLDITQPASLQGARPDATGIPPVAGDWRRTLQYLDRAAFAPVPRIAQSGATAHPGTLGRAAVRGPGQWNLDLSIGKEFGVRERARVQFRTEMLNAFNHTNFAAVDTNIDSNRFGRLTGTAGARRIQFQLRFTF